MKTIKTHLTAILVLLSAVGFTQEDNFEKSFSGKTNFMVSFYHLGGFNKENPTFYLEQHFDYQAHPKFSFGGGFGVNIYPALLATPIFIHAKYHFKIKSVGFYLHQSLGRNIKIFDFAFRSNRYLGTLGAEFNLKERLKLTTELGYSFIWDKHGGLSLSNFVGLGIQYKIGKKSSS